MKTPGRVVVAVAGATLALLTYQLNPGSVLHVPVVLVNLSQHGHLGLFLLTATAACLACVAAARQLPDNRWVRWIGQNTLVLMALNTLYFLFGNYVLVPMLEIGPTQLELIAWCGTIGIIQILTLVPLILLFNRYIPQLIGRPGVEGPLLPRLVSRTSKGP